MPPISTHLAVDHNVFAVDVWLSINDVSTVLIFGVRVEEMNDAVFGIEIALASVGEQQELIAQHVSNDITEGVRIMYQYTICEECMRSC